MSITDIFRVNKIKADLGQAQSALEAVQKERDVLKATLSTTEHMEFYELQRAIADLRDQKERALNETAELEARNAQRKQELDQQIHDLERQAQTKREDLDRQTRAKREELDRQIKARQDEVILLDEEILLQSFGFYKPRYDLLNAEAYKSRLEQIRKQQEDFVKNGRAATCPTNWTVNNSQREGDRMIRDYTKLILRSFNNECDASIINIKFNNIESIEKKIRKAFDTLNTLAKRMSITIVPEYLNLKLQELYLNYEYQLKKQQEKEEQKRVREQMREEAKLLKEIEDAKLKLGKEEKHFTKAIASIDAQLQRVSTDAERELLEKERASIQERLAEIEKDKQDVQNRERNTRAGYVYVISNLGAFGENVYKIGVTRRLDPQERIDELGDASVPFDFDIHAMIFSDDAPALETALHRSFEPRRLNMINRRREFFYVTLKEIEHVVKTNFSKPVEFIELADAPEYRQSRALRGQQ